MPTQFVGWLSKITDIVNLGKLVVDGGPGTVLAIALVSILARFADVPILPIGETFETKRADSAREVLEQREAVARREQELQALIINQADDASLLGARRTELESVRNARSGLQLQGIERGTVRYARLAERESVLEDEIKALGSDIAAREGDKARLTEELTADRAELNRRVQRSDALHVLRVEHGNDILALVLDQAIGLVIVGYVLGTLLNPVYRALFINSFDSLVARYPATVRLLGGTPKPPDADRISALRHELLRHRRRLAMTRRMAGT